ncbi:MAG TPA: mechanosensitive ion channel [Flavobacteriaceae bacterium]|nr:mechanosensitive ion channel [Flavobacteriaceae bacterium]
MHYPASLGALFILLIGWLIAKGVRTLVIKLMQKTAWDEKIFKSVSDGRDTNRFVGNLVYYLIMIIVFLIVLESLGIHSVLRPLENMVNEFLVFIPHLLAAGIIATIGYLLAKFVSNLIQVGGKFLDKLVARTGFKDTERVVKIIRTFVFLIIFIPMLIEAINALQLESISDPLNLFLAGFIAIIGDIIVATAILLVFVIGGKYLTKYLTELFQNLGMDTLAEKLQLHNMIGPKQSFSKLIAGVLYFFISFLGVITAVDILGLFQLTYILNDILAVTGSIAFGVVVLIIGNFISSLIYKGMLRSDKNKFIATIVRYASLALFIGIALRTMGIANEIVELAFGLTLGAVAVVIALSYGLGGREAAGEHFKEIIQKTREKNSDIDSKENKDPKV